MSIRDVLVFALIFGAIPFILRRPWIGVMFWVWVGVMNPHRLTWGAAYDFPFALVIGIATLAGTLFTSEPRRFKGGAAAGILACYLLLACASTAFALVPDQALPMLERVLKIHALTFLALFVLYRREHVIALVGLIALSIGYYAVKGGLFTIATLGNYRVWGPSGSFIAENNALALATVMTIPLWAFLYTLRKNFYWRAGTVVIMVLSAVSALGSHSRGALVAIGAMVFMLWLKTQQKLATGILIALIGAGLLAFMPQSWEQRMGTIAEYEQDESAMGRIETWKMMSRIASDRPLVGGGFEPYAPEVLQRYNPGYGTVRSAHSIYFQVLGELGFLGLALFLAFWIATWRVASSIAREAKRPDEDWAYWLARMSQVSLVAYFVGGAFLNLGNWDMPYYLMVALAVTRHLLRERQSSTAATAVSAPAGRTLGTHHT